MAAAINRERRAVRDSMPAPIPLWHAYCLSDSQMHAASAVAAEGRAMRQIGTRAGRFLGMALLAAAGLLAGALLFGGGVWFGTLLR